MNNYLFHRNLPLLGKLIDQTMQTKKKAHIHTKTDGALLAKRIGILLVIFIGFNSALFGVTKTSNGGNWNTAGTWTPNGVPLIGDDVILNSGTTTLNVSTVNLLSFTINNGATFTTSGAFSVAGGTITVNGTYINASSGAITGTMTVGATGVYRHNFTTTAGTIPTATWSAGSTCLISGYTSPGNGTTPGGIGQTFSNFTWSCAAQASRCIAWGATTAVNGDYTIANTNANIVYFADAANLTVSIAGNYVQTGGEMRFTRGTGNATVNIAGDLNLSGGTLNIDNGGNGGSTVNLA